MTEDGDNRIVIAGCGPGAPDHMTPLAHSAVAGASVLAGAQRLLALFPDFRGVRVPVNADIENVLDMLAQYIAAHKRVVVLVTGDPGICSLAQPIVRRFGADRCRIIPGISAVQAAFARLVIEWTDAQIINAHAGVPGVSIEALAHERAVAVVGGNAKSWPWVLSLAERLEGTHTLHLCRNLTLPGEEVVEVTAAQLKNGEAGAGLSVLVWKRLEGVRCKVLGVSVPECPPYNHPLPPTTRHRPPGPITVHFVGAGPGDPELLTRKAERLLRECRCCIWAGSLVNPALLDLLPPDAERHDSSSMTLDEIVAVIKRCHGNGLDVVRLHTGDPALFSAIGEQMTRLKKLGIDYEVVPGISSYQAAAATLKCELTAPEVSQAVMLTRTPGRTPVPDAHTLEKAARLRATLCVFLSTDRIEEVVRTLQPHYGASCPAAVIYHASWPDEKVVRGTLDNIAALVQDAGLTRTGMIIVGQALDVTITESRLYSADFAHGYRKASSSAEQADTP